MNEKKEPVKDWEFSLADGSIIEPPLKGTRKKAVQEADRLTNETKVKVYVQPKGSTFTASRED